MRVVSVIIGIIFAISCSDDFMGEGSNFLDDSMISELRNDSLDVKTWISFPDTTPYSMYHPPLNILGELNDPVFGKTKSSIVFTCTPSLTSTESNNTGTGVTIDSVHFTFGYKSFYGASGASGALDIELYRLSPGTLMPYQRYNSKDQHLISQVENPTEGNLLEKPLSISPKTYVDTNLKADTLIYTERFRVSLSKSFGLALLNILSQSSDIPSFTQLLGGLSLRASTSNTGSLLYVKLNTSRTNQYLFYSTNLAGFTSEGQAASIEVYYHNTEGDTSSRTFLVNSYAQNISLFQPEQTLTNPQLDDEIYLQPMDGWETNIIIPATYFEKFEEDDLVAEARLTLQVEDYQNELFPPPSNLFLRRVVGLDSLYVLPEEEYRSLGGSYDSKNKQYQFNLTATILDHMLNGARDEDIVLRIQTGLLDSTQTYYASGRDQANRVVLSSPQLTISIID